MQGNINFFDNLDICWTEFEDKILQNFKKDNQDDLLNRLFKIKGRQRVIKRILFLKLYKTL